MKSRAGLPFSSSFCLPALAKSAAMKGLSLVPCLLALAAVSPVLADPPAITNQPQDILVNKYSAAQFSVGASGAVSYQWSLNNATVDGATNATFSLDDVTDPATVS